MYYPDSCALIMYPTYRSNRMQQFALIFISKCAMGSFEYIQLIRGWVYIYIYIWFTRKSGNNIFIANIKMLLLFALRIMVKKSYFPDPILLRTK